MTEKIYKAGAEGWDFLFQYMPGGVYVCRRDERLTLLWLSSAFREMTGCGKRETSSNDYGSFMEMVHEEDRELVREATGRELESGDYVELEYRVRRKDGSLLWVLDKGRMYVTPEGEEAFVCLLVDITERKRMEEALRLSLERYQVIADQTTDIIFEWDIRGDTLFLSANWHKKFGYDPLDSKISLMLPCSEKIHSEDKEALLRIMADMRQGQNYAETEFRIANILGEHTWCRIRATAQFDEESRPIKAVGVIIDIEEEKSRQQELLKAARQDALTGLLNKTECKHRIEEYLSGTGNGALLLMDLDDFKRVNDRYGHLCGDAVLSDTAAVLRKLFGAGGVTGRIGGDEFMIFLPGAGGKEALDRAGGIAELLREKRLPDPRDVICSSVGIALWPEDGETFFELYRKADKALYYSKNHGKDNVTLYDEALCQNYGEGNQLVQRSGTVIESEELTDVEERLVSYTFRMLYHSQNIEEAVDTLLEIVGRAYDVSRVYIFENTPDDKCCNNTFEWCNEGIEPQKDRLQGISYEEDLDDYRENFDENGVFYCEDIHKLKKKLYDILAPQDIKSLLQCAIIDDQEFKGYVGFDECRQNRYWTGDQIKSLGLIANILSEFLLKQRLKERLRENELQLLRG